MVKRVTRPMLGFNSFRSAGNILAGIELMHMARNGHLLLEEVDTMSFADQYYALAGKVGPASGAGDIFCPHSPLFR